MEIQEVRNIVRGVDGWLDYGEGELLYRLASECSGEGVIVEIGSWKGKSTIWLAAGSLRGKRVSVHAIDPHLGSPEHRSGDHPVWTFDDFKANINMAGVQEMVVPIVETSEQAGAKFVAPVSLVFIDGAHEYEAVRLDFEVWFPKVVIGGIVAFHDTIGWEGVKRLVEERVFRSTEFKRVRFIHSITYGIKVGENSSLERFHNRYVLTLKNLYEKINAIKLPRVVRILMVRLFHAIQ